MKLRCFLMKIKDMATDDWIRSSSMVPRMDSDEFNGTTVDAELKPDNKYMDDIDMKCIEITFFQLDLRF